MTREAPAWLAELQAAFGRVLRTPLDRASGTLAATPAAYDARALGEARDGPVASGAERLAVYNRQYWFRLFGVLQGAFPLTARLVGYWSFNGIAERFLTARPPRGWDVDQVADGFEAFFEAEIEGEELDRREGLVEAARIDAAWREVFRAPNVPPFRPSAEDAPRFLDARLVRSPATRIVEEHRPLVALRRTLTEDESERGVELPARNADAQSWALVRRDEGILQIALEPREAELLRLLEEKTLRDALGCLEASCSAEERATLPARARAWLGRGVEVGFWTRARNA